jgi:hypothetical protein
MERRIAILEGRCSRLTIAVSTISTIWVATVLLYVISFPVPRVYGEAAPGVLKVRALVVVDEKGSERVRIGAPIAGSSNSSLPIWRTPVSGIILYGPDGKGRAGFVTTDTKASHVCLRMHAEGSQAISLASPHDSDLCQ